MKKALREIEAKIEYIGRCIATKEKAPILSDVIDTAIDDALAEIRHVAKGFSTHSDGGDGSGNWGHVGVKGQWGGSAPGGGKAFRVAVGSAFAKKWGLPESESSKYTSYSKKIESMISKAIDDYKTSPDKATAAAAKAMAKAWEAERKSVDKIGYYDPDASKHIVEKGIPEMGWDLTKSELKDKYGIDLDKPKLEIKPEPKVEPKAEPKVEPKTEPKAEPKVEPAPKSENIVVSKHGADGLKASEMDASSPTLKNFDAKRAAAMSACKWDDETQIKAQETMKEIFDNNDFCMKVDGKYLGAIMESDFKSQIELKNGHSGGYYGPGYRKQMSQETFGTSKSAPEDNYEKYGYLGKADDPNELFGSSGGTKQYGDVLVKFKKEDLANRTTYTQGDSLGARRCGMVDTNPSLEGLRTSSSVTGSQFKNGELSTLSKMRSDCGYVELQYHDKVKPSNVESITFQGWKEAKAYIDKLSPAAKSNIADNGIKICYHSKSKGYQTTSISSFM